MPVGSSTLLRSNGKTKLSYTSLPFLFLVFVCLILAAVLSNLEFFKDLPSKSFSATQFSPPPLYNLAKQQSFGFFDDISDEHWQLLQQRARGSLFLSTDNPEEGFASLALWFLNNVDPLFTCLGVRRVGGFGDGPKWVCDPHRLLKVNDCMVYSIGSRGEFRFEDGLQTLLGEHCEIHVFDPDPSYASEANRRNLYYHPWGLTSSYAETRKFGNNWIFKSLQEMIKELGHEGRRIDIFKIDCEGCEWFTFQDWLNARVDIRQILVETHPHRLGKGVTASGFFTTLLQNGYVPFSKEANTHPHAKPVGALFEYGLIRLHSSFFEGSAPQSLVPI